MLPLFTACTNLASNENDILNFWVDKNVRKLVEEKNAMGETFRFLDGPPFVSSKDLHYGHVHIGMGKSCVVNYQQMLGSNVTNMIGYDVHGLPIEMVVSKLLNLSTNAEIKKYGLANYNNKCEEVINTFSGSWKNIFNRIGRFVDFDNEYKTMDFGYMESTWWAFGQLWKKGLIYRGYKIMPYSIECGTSISNSEASGDDVFKEVADKSIYVKLKVVGQENTFLIIWTTTPWTLPSNLAVGANPAITYHKIHDHKADQYFILAELSLPKLYGKQKPYTLVGQVSVIGLQYEPLFDYYATSDPESKKFTVINAKFVTDTSGTSLVHLAPAFGQDDCDVCVDSGVIPANSVGHYCPIDENGYFTATVRDFQGQKCLNANEGIIQMLKSRGDVVKVDMYRHRYPHCWRTDTPLIYKSISSFFIKVTDITGKMVEHNAKINWVPSHIGSKRFRNWIQNASDWGVSRSRFFGTPVPVWISDDGEEMVCVGSVEELMELTETKIKLTNIHPQYIHNLTIMSSTGKTLRWCGQTLDCWFESGCAPFAQLHYPFENESAFDGRDFLCDFICEGLDQTRGWFYTLTVLSSALFDRPAFKNVICNGLILADDGKKYSKRSGNYSDPIDLCNQYSADAIRLYLIGSPAVHGEEIKMETEQIKKISYKYGQLANVYNFLAENINHVYHNGGTVDLDAYQRTTNILDLWILKRVAQVIEMVQRNMATYTLHNIKPIILDFIEDIANWYVKFNRNRLQFKNTNFEDRCCALSVLHRALLVFIKSIAPFAPFFSESIYQLLKKMLNHASLSVHMCSYPTKEDVIVVSNQGDIITHMSNLQAVVTTVRNLRAASKTASNGKMPLRRIIISNTDESFLNGFMPLLNHVKKETNALDVIVTTGTGNVSYKIVPDNKSLGIKFKNNASKVKMLLDMLPQDVIVAYLQDTSVGLQFGDHILDESMFSVTVNRELHLEANQAGKIVGQTGIIIDLTQDDEIISLYVTRLFIRAIQTARKEAKLNPLDRIKIYYQTNDTGLDTIVQNNLIMIIKEIGYIVTGDVESGPVIISKEVMIRDSLVNLTIMKS